MGVQLSPENLDSVTGGGGAIMAGVAGGPAAGVASSPRTREPRLRSRRSDPLGTSRLCFLADCCCCCCCPTGGGGGGGGDGGESGERDESGERGKRGEERGDGDGKGVVAEAGGSSICRCAGSLEKGSRSAAGVSAWGSRWARAEGLAFAGGALLPLKNSISGYLPENV